MEAKSEREGALYFLLLSMAFRGRSEKSISVSQRGFKYPGSIPSRQAKCRKVSAPGPLGPSVLRLKRVQNLVVSYKTKHTFNI